jgi:hypothetical protein
VHFFVAYGLARNKNNKAYGLARNKNRLCKGWDNRIVEKQQQKHTQINKIKK